MRQVDSTAYDYSIFEPKPAQKAPDIKEVAIRKHQHRKVHFFRKLVYIIVAISMVSSLLYCKAMQVELDAQHSQVAKLVKDAESENIRLKVLLESNLSLKKIEEIATEEMGLEKVDDLKIEYINFNECDKAEVLSKKGFFENILDTIKGFFS